MLTIWIIYVCFMCLTLLMGLSFLICFIGRKTESLPYTITAIFAGFFLSYIMIDFTFLMLTKMYKLPPAFWESIK